ncbi:MAG: hypothetical protein JSV78_10665 [Phycisphaerales bacterium]|nr:MAG: hypothetical protein JSV78_10665 [Phycisphaerales bacterium]
MSRGIARCACSALLCAAWLVLTPAPARADIWGDIAVALDYANFNLFGQRNYLSGGAEFVVNNQFRGNELDFGSWQMRLEGPVSFGFKTGGRGLSNLEISLQTALTSDQLSEPLSYDVVFDVGGQRSEVAGSVFLDSRLWLNGFGFYELELDYSSRQTITGEGRFNNDQQINDFDVGPIDIRGNIFADLLDLIFAPLFGDNPTPFDSFSGRAQLAKLLDLSDPMNDPIVLKGRLFETALAETVDPLVLERALNLQTTTLANFNSMLADQQPGTSIPEPAALVLMLVGAAFVAPRTLRRCPRTR